MLLCANYVRDNKGGAMCSMENNAQSEKCVRQRSIGVALTFHGIAIFSREHMEPRVDFTTYTKAIFTTRYVFICR